MARRSNGSLGRMASLAAIVVLTLASPCGAAPDDDESAVGPVMRLLKSGRVPAARLGSIVDIVCERGNATDLRYILDRCLAPDGFPPDLRAAALGKLVEAAELRGLVPSGALDALAGLYDDAIEARDDAVLGSAIRLARAWKVRTLAARLEALVDAGVSDLLLRDAIGALAVLSGEDAVATIERFCAPERPIGARILAVAALAEIALERAAPIGARILAAADDEREAAALVAAFLDRDGGSEKLAAALEGIELPADVAKLALRSIYAAGRSDPELADTLSSAAGISAGAIRLSESEQSDLVRDVLARGDAATGEDIFRRDDVGCQKCHALSGAGGNVGPDLSAVGASTPVDYLLQSILDPNAQIKEAFHSATIITKRGAIHSGVVVDKTDARVILRDTAGQEIAVARADIASETEGGSLMPEGLTRFLTRGELVDLLRFIAELGKPGPYAVNDRGTIQRWRYLLVVTGALESETPDGETFRTSVHENRLWVPAYAKVAGDLPLDTVTRAPRSVAYIYGEFDATDSGAIDLELDDSSGVEVWLDTKRLDTQRLDTQRGVEVGEGRHRVTLRIDRRERARGSVRVRVTRVSGSAVAVTIVGGR